MVELRLNRGHLPTWGIPGPVGGQSKSSGESQFALKIRGLWVAKRSETSDRRENIQLQN
jgi:hypothetical protein